jgi:hypothetical protein
MESNPSNTRQDTITQFSKLNMNNQNIHLTQVILALVINTLQTTLISLLYSRSLALSVALYILLSIE